MRGGASHRGRRWVPRGAGVLLGRGLLVVSWLHSREGVIRLCRWREVPPRRGWYRVERVPPLLGSALPTVSHLWPQGRSRFDPFEVFFGGHVAFEGGGGSLLEQVGPLLANGRRLGGGCLGERRGAAPGRSAGGERAKGRGMVRQVMFFT